MNLSILDGREELWQWDTGVRLAMDEACEMVNISASTFGVSVDVTAAEDGKTWVAAVPDEMLQVPGDLICYAVQSTATGTITAAYRSFRVNRRPKPYGYVATPTEARTWQQLLEFCAVNQEKLDGKIDAPQTAQVGEVLTVEEVDAEGKPKKWKTQTAAAGIDVVTEITAEGTNEQIPSAKAVYTGIANAQKVKIVNFTFTGYDTSTGGGHFELYSADTSLNEIIQGLEQGIAYIGFASGDAPPGLTSYNIYQVSNISGESVNFIANYDSFVRRITYRRLDREVEIFGETVSTAPEFIYMTRTAPGSNTLKMDEIIESTYVRNHLAVTTVCLAFEDNIYYYSGEKDYKCRFSAIIESDEGLKYSVIIFNDLAGSATLHETKIQ